MKFAICNLGCKVNNYESNWYRQQLSKQYQEVDFKEFSDKSHIDMSDGIFIDDSVNNLITSNAELKICFGDEYDWNKNWNGIRCANWCDIWRLIGNNPIADVKNINKF